jgi:hypothetical protein
MRIFIALVASLAACGAPKSKGESALVNEGSDVPATCCCKSIDAASENDATTYDMINRMECSTHHGDCVPDVQCQGRTAQTRHPAEKSTEPTTTDTGVPPPPSLAPEKN